MYETNSAVSSQAVPSASLNASSFVASVSSDATVASVSSSMAMSSSAADTSSLSEDESAVISISSLSQSVVSSMSTSTSSAMGENDAAQFLTKPIDLYTPTEGFLFLLVLLGFTALIFSIFGLWRCK